MHEEQSAVLTLLAPCPRPGICAGAAAWLQGKQHQAWAVASCQMQRTEGSLRSCVAPWPWMFPDNPHPSPVAHCARGKRPRLGARRRSGGVLASRARRCNSHPSLTKPPILMNDRVAGWMVSESDATGANVRRDLWHGPYRLCHVSAHGLSCRLELRRTRARWLDLRLGP